MLISNPFSRRVPLTEVLHSTNPFPDFQHRSSFRAVPLTATGQSSYKIIVHNVLSPPPCPLSFKYKRGFSLIKGISNKDPKRFSLSLLRRYLLGFTSSLVPLPKVSLFVFPEFTQSNPPLQKPPNSCAHFSCHGSRLYLSLT